MRYFIVILTAITMLLTPTVASAAAPPTDCYEDQPCFVWSKLGNHKRGVRVWKRGIVVDRVVGPCEFAKLDHAKRLDSTTVKLRGDVWAHWQCD